MIYILEGCNGVGKSTYAHALSEQLDIPLYRPFKQGNTDLHWNYEPEVENRLRNKFKIPLNTHVEDLMTADVLGALRPDAILDRSLPSAVAYGIMHGHMDNYYHDKALCRELLAYWQELLSQRFPQAMYIWLRASFQDAKKRVGDRWFPSRQQWDKLEKVFGAIFTMDINMPKRQINTSEILPADGVESIWQQASKI